MDARTEPAFEIDVRPGFLITVASLVVAYTAFHAVVSARAGVRVPLADSLNWAAAVTILILLGTLLHELGHVAAGLAVGHRWTRAIFNGAGLGVVIEPPPHGWHRIVRSLAGPVVQFLVALPLLAIALAGTPHGRLSVMAAELSIWWMGGACNLFVAVLNLLPIPGFDGAKVLVGVRELLRSRLES